MIHVTRPDLSGDAYSKPEEIAEIILFILTHRNNSVLDEIYIRRHAKPPFEPYASRGGSSVIHVTLSGSAPTSRAASLQRRVSVLRAGFFAFTAALRRA